VKSPSSPTTPPPATANREQRPGATGPPKPTDPLTSPGRGAPAPSRAASKPISTPPAAASSKSQTGELSRTLPATPLRDAPRAVGRGHEPRPSAVHHEPGPSAQPEPRSPFTVVRKGETLRDVAVRVYGSADPLDSLWRANRDLLPRQDSPLAPGSVLRTPEE
jgi:hypothetical protein